MLPLLAGIALIVTPSSALAKLPPFTVELEPRTPVAGEPVTVTVRFWEDPAHTEPSRWVDMPAFDTLLWAYRMEDSRSVDATRVEMRLVRRGVYRGEVTFAAPGPWALCPWRAWCGAETDVPGYPARLEITVEPAAPAVDESAGSVGSSPPTRSPDPAGSAVPVAGAIAAAAAVSVALGAGVRRSRRLRGRTPR